MAITYYKRFRMEIDLDGAITRSVLPRSFVWVPWEESLLDQHAEVKYRVSSARSTPTCSPAWAIATAAGG